MIKDGWVEEARRLAALPDWKNSPACSSLGYAEMTEVAEGRMDASAAMAAIQKRTRNYAKRQGTFFRRQLPGAIRWDIDALTALCEACGWRWESVSERLNSPGNDGKSGV
jgi:tRNA dimethylallyltransferase